MKPEEKQSTSRRVLAAREHRRRSLRSRYRRQAFIGLVVVGITTLTLLAVGMDRLLRPGAFPIEELRLKGAFNRLDPAQVQRIIVDELGDNYFSLDLAHIEQIVEALPWAREARVRRSWPNRLNVTIEEQHPVARWGESEWLNDRAEIVQLGDDVGIDGLVALSGPDSSARDVWHRYNQWAPMLREVGLEVVSIDVDERFAWTLQVSPQQVPYSSAVLLGTEHHDRRVQRLIGSYSRLQNQAGVILTMDLRYPNGMAITQGNGEKGNDVALNEVDQ